MEKISEQQAGLMATVTANEDKNESEHQRLKLRLEALQAKISTLQNLQAQIDTVNAESKVTQQETTELAAEVEELEVKQSQAAPAESRSSNGTSRFRRTRSMASVTESRQRLAAVNARAGALALALMAHVPRNATPLSTGAGKHNPYIV